MDMNRRGFLRSVVLGVGATVTLAAVGFDKTLKAVGLKKKCEILQWEAKFKKFGMGGWLHKVKLNIPDGIAPPFDKSWNGMPYERFSFNPTTRKVVYLFRAPERILQRPPSQPPANVDGLYSGKTACKQSTIATMFLGAGDDSIKGTIPSYSPPYYLTQSMTDETYTRSYALYKKLAGKVV